MLRPRFLNLFHSSNNESPCRIPEAFPTVVRQHVRERKIGRAFTELTPQQLLDKAHIYLSRQFVPTRGLSQIAWSFGQLGETDSAVWTSISRHFPSTLSSPSDAALTLFSMANAVQREPSLLSEDMKNVLTHSLTAIMGSAQFIESVSLCDSAQLSFALTSMFPRNARLATPFITRATRLLEKLPKSPPDDEETPVLDSCKNVCLLWSVARMRKLQKRDGPFVEALCEATRGLRSCSDFNQNKVAQICDSIAALNVSDPRVVYQVILFLDTNREVGMNGKNILRVIRGMGQLGVDNPVLWRRLGNRLEQALGLDYSFRELEEIKRVFTKLNPRNQRVQGILDLYLRTKQEVIQYGT